MSHNNTDKKPKPIIDKAAIAESIKVKDAAIKNNQIIKK